MFELLLSALGVALHAVVDFVLDVLSGSRASREVRATRRRVRALAQASDWAGIEREFAAAMAAGTSTQLPSAVIDAIPKQGARPLAHVIARGLRVGDPLTLMPAARIAPHTADPAVHAELVILRDSGDERLKAVADYALRRWPKAAA
jgi:hypothetical protein